MPVKFLFLPKMGLIGSKASTLKKSIMNFELLLSCFSMSSWAIFLPSCSNKLFKIKVKKVLKIWEVFFGVGEILCF